MTKNDPISEEQRLRFGNIVEPSQWRMTHESDALNASIMQFDLNEERQTLIAQPANDESGQRGKTLVKEADLRIVLMYLPAGGRVEKHKASGPISVQPLEGQLRLVLPDRTVTLSTGHLLALEPSIPHDVEAIEDTTFLLTLGRTTYPVLERDTD